MGTTAVDHDYQHWEIRELLGRYAELLETNEDVEKMYPAVAAHLRECTECRAILEDLLEPHTDTPVDSKITQDAIDFLQQSHPSAVVLVRRSSEAISRKIHIAFPVDIAPDNPLTRNVAMRGLSPIQPGGRLILYTNIPFEDQRELIVMLTLHGTEEADRYTVRGELSGEPLPVITEALLHVGQQTYTATIERGTLQFSHVQYDDSVSRVSLTIDTTLPNSHH